MESKFKHTKLLVNNALLRENYFKKIILRFGYQLVKLTKLINLKVQTHSLTYTSGTQHWKTNNNLNTNLVINLCYSFVFKVLGFAFFYWDFFYEKFKIITLESSYDARIFVYRKTKSDISSHFYVNRKSCKKILVIIDTEICIFVF